MKNLAAAALELVLDDVEQPTVQALDEVESFEVLRADGAVRSRLCCSTTSATTN
jgi:hypothetical protein